MPLGGPIDPDVAARAIVDATLIGDEESAKKHNISTRTLLRYRAKLSDNAELAQLVVDKRSQIDSDWAEQLPEAIHAAIGFLKRASEEADHKDPQVIYSVAGALKILTDVTMSRRVLDARLAKQLGQGDARVSGENGSSGETPGEGAPSEDDQLGLQ